METEVRRRIDPTQIPDETLTRFRKLAVTRVLPIAPRFGEWLVEWIGSEQYHRQADPDHRHKTHLLALPLCSDWTDKEIGQTLRAVTILSSIPMHGSLDAFLDRLTLAVGEVAADRLEAHD